MQHNSVYYTRTVVNWISWTLSIAFVVRRLGGRWGETAAAVAVGSLDGEDGVLLALGLAHAARHELRGFGQGQISGAVVAC